MLELIVLGRIPGTHIQITFNWFLLVVAIMLSGIELRTLYLRHREEIIAMIFLFKPFHRA
jgi:hypothetical protein